MLNISVRVAIVVIFIHAFYVNNNYTKFVMFFIFAVLIGYSASVFAKSMGLKDGWMQYSLPYHIWRRLWNLGRRNVDDK
jgi:hypothetical protein